MADFRSLLEELHWSKAELARRLGIHKNTVSDWGDDAPEYAMAHLRLMVGVKRLLG